MGHLKTKSLKQSLYGLLLAKTCFEKAFSADLF